jgi:signal transduction histidine kinase
MHAWWDQLRSSREDLQGLSQELLGVQEAERRHLARELHDEIGQALTGLSLTLEMIAHYMAALKEDLQSDNA